MPKYLFHSDTNQQLFEAALADREVVFERTDKTGEVMVEDDKWSDLAYEYGADFT